MEPTTNVIFVALPLVVTPSVRFNTRLIARSIGEYVCLLAADCA
jgi:hypothetical protein